MKFFLPNTLKNYILNGKFNPKMDKTGVFFSENHDTSFDFQKRVEGHPPSCTSVSVAEYALISLNVRILKNASINCSDYARDLNIPDHLI